jgi:membrane protease YdiL (CAAX protease family)
MYRNFFPAGWQKRIVVIIVAALAGNYVLSVIPWPEFMLSGYRRAAEAAPGGTGFLVLTLFLAPVAEEGIFRLFLYGGLREKAGLGFLPAAMISSLAFGLYHGNWIQGIYAFLIGMILAWGYEDSSRKKFMMAVLMHMAANLAAIAVFTWAFGLVKT